MDAPVYRILPPDTDRYFMELDSESTDTLVVSLHKDVVRDLGCSQYEFAALLWLVLEQAGTDRAEKLVVKNLAIGLFLMPLDFLSPGEVLEAVDRLAARGFAERIGSRGVRLNPHAASVIERSELPARFRMEWNAAKIDWPGVAVPISPDDPGP